MILNDNICEQTAYNYLYSIGWQPPQDFKKSITLGEVFDDWSKKHFPKVSKKTMLTDLSIWKQIAPLSDLPFCEIRAHHLQAILNNNYAKSKSWQDKYLQLCRSIFKHAQNMEVVEINYAQFLEKAENLSAVNKERELFTRSEIFKLIEYANNKTNLYWRDARITLILIFTGFRPSELFSLTLKNTNITDWYVISGSKTRAGMARPIPVIEIIQQYIYEFYLTADQISRIHHVQNMYLLPAIAMPSKKEITYFPKMSLDNWRPRRFYPLMKELGFNSFNGEPRLTPYSARHTFASLAYEAGVKPEILKKIFGHVDFELLAKIYIHNDIQQYRSELNKITDFIEIKNIENEVEE